MALLALTCTQLRSPTTWIAAVVAACAAVAAYALPLKLNIVVAIAAAVAVGVLADRARAFRGGAGP
jgi:predicted branched-subunit amino acid permease